MPLHEISAGGQPPGYEFDYAEITTSVSVTATAEATPTDVVALPARVYDGTTTILIEFYTSAILTGGSAASQVIVNLWDGATDLGRIAFAQTPATNNLATPCYAVRRLTPTAASHTYSIKAWRGVSNGTIVATAAHLPAFIRASKV